MKINLLGPMEVTDDGVQLRIPGEKLRAVLAALALSVRRSVSRSELIDELWGETPPNSAGNSLHGHIARLRRVLVAHGGRSELRDVIRTSPTGYVLDLAPENVDVSRLFRLVARADAAAAHDPRTAVDLLNEALALWRGPALVDAGNGMICQVAYTQLEEVRLGAYERLFDIRLRLDQARAVIPDLELLHARYPLHERFCEQLITALYLSGRQADALNTYHRTRDYLSQHLGLQPGHGLRDRVQDILRQAPHLI
ncbi:AfsR/SARP family transcriptional regulator [Streptomyces bohaiensis]|uniref:AfsR/SARP family transcriptional regulator n=2 Tax=Streptomyces bohaiensis TaxID=1431344 RepID=A0ABX1C364_9ACTN|nr:AfsR/SARP family transcriptional regulator [Streptomyces bohaiensis]